MIYALCFVLLAVGLYGALAKRLHVPALFIGLTIVAFGTSAPEFVVGIKSALAGRDAIGIAVGNVVGSNVANVLLVLGVPALIYQVVWTREVALLAGGQLDAIATVVAAFFGGLALGSRVLGGAADRVRSPLRFYAALELVAAAIAIAATALLRALTDHGPAHPGALLVISGAAILPVTFALGGTQPALLRSATAREAFASISVESQDVHWKVLPHSSTPRGVRSLS